MSIFNISDTVFLVLVVAAALGTLASAVMAVYSAKQEKADKGK